MKNRLIANNDGTAQVRTIHTITIAALFLVLAVTYAILASK